MNTFKVTPIRLELVLLLGVMLVSGCSGSSDSSSEGTQPADDNNVVALDDSDDAVETDADMGTNTDTDTDADTDDAGSTQDDSDSLTQYTTQVNFDITVPVYASNKLQVGLVWGDKDIRAMWVGDELWTVSEDFQIDMEHRLTVSFYDDNGDVVLGTYEASYKTGFNDAESYQITADQFDTDRWDDDGDGHSNIAELIAGTDPFVDESDQTDVNLVDAVGGNFIFFDTAVRGATYYEAELISLTFPVDIHEEVVADNRPQHFESTSRDIDISIDGNGTYRKSHDIKPGQDQPFHRSSNGTRTRQGNTVRWSGTQLVYTSSLLYNGYYKEEFETSNTLIERELVQESSGTSTGKRGPIENTDNIVNYNYEVVLDLDSMDSENTCAVLRGNLTQSLETNLATDTPSLTEQTLGRSSTDENWAWVSTIDGEIKKGEAINLNQRFYCNFLID